MVRTCMYLIYGMALAAAIGGALILLDQFVVWLQTGTWPRLTLLGLAIDWRLIPGNWARYPEVADTVFTLLRSIPVSVALLALCPPIWWIGNRIKRRL